MGVFIAFYEIYCGKLFDLLNNRTVAQKGVMCCLMTLPGLLYQAKLRLNS